MSTLGWIAVPGGRVIDAKAVLRVLVVPRLQQPLIGTAMQDWPAVVNEATPVVEVKLSTSEIRPVPCAVRRIADSEVWRGFFGNGITVKPWLPPASPPVPEVRPTLRSAGAVMNAYSAAVNDPAVAPQQLASLALPPDPPPVSGPAAAFPKVDFHRAVSLLREHPHVLTALGLILELELPVADLPPGDGDPATLIRVSWPASPIPIESPWTAYEFNGDRFLPASSGDLISGQVDLADDGKWEVITFDVDGAVGKLREAARAGAEVLPTLRSAGLQLVRKGRAEQLATRSGRVAGPLTDRVFDADDLVLGYRLDVRPQQSNTWFSLHLRRAGYTVGGRSIGPAEIVEEGHLKPFAAVRDGTGLHTDEIVARWSGWSLSVPRPTFDGQPPHGVPTELAGERIPYRFTMLFSAVPDSLPELKFGMGYQLRARVVDVAGGGLLVDDPDAAFSPTAEIHYARYEPVPPPDLVPAGTPTGTAERVVIGTGISDNIRSFRAPATTFQLADHHGVLSIDDETGWARASRTGGLNPAANLPDPMGLGIAATLLPQPGGLDEEHGEARPWAGVWPDHDPKQLELVPGEMDDPIALRWLASDDVVAPEEDAQSTTVRVTLPPGEQVTVEISSTVLFDNLDHFSFRSLISDSIGQSAAAGRHPMLTPARRLELIHAVRRPLRPPVGGFTTARPEDATFVVLQPHDPILGLHTQSTAQLALKAEWDEWGDAPTPTTTTALVPPVTVSYGATELPELRQEFGDTRHRMVRYTATAASRYRAFFEPDPDDSSFTVATDFDPVSVQSTMRPPPPIVLSTVPAFSWSEQSRPGGGLIRRRSCGMLRVELARPWFVTGQDERLAVLVWPGTEDSVPAAARSMVSWLNRDPIHPTPAPVTALAAESMFAGAIEPVDVMLTDTEMARALPYPVFFAGDHWYADIALPGMATSSYCPFVHLAVARFQRESLGNRNLSAVVHTDMVPVLPDRSLELHTDADGLHLTLSGLSRPNVVTATIERCEATDDVVDITALNAGIPAFPAWTRVPGLVSTGETNKPLPPLQIPADSGRLRVVVRETEVLRRTPAALIDSIGELTERTVYLDAVPLPLI